MNMQLELDCQVIPVESGNLLIPSRMVEEVVMLEEKDTQERMTWRSRKVPIIQQDIHNKPTARVVVIRSVMGYQGLPFLAIAADGIPHQVTVSPDTLTQVPESQIDSVERCYLAAAYASVGSLVCAIPDLPRLESKLAKSIALENHQSFV